MVGRKSFLFASLASGAILGISTLACADTITVHDISHNSATGVYVYSVQFDQAADVHTNDGFVIYDFNDLVSWQLTGDLTTADFALNQTLTSNTLDQASSVDINGAVAAFTNGLSFDNPSVPNLSFDYDGPSPFLGASMGTLTIVTSDLGNSTTSVVATVDDSGPLPSIPYSFADNAITVPGLGAPNSSPLVPASVGGAVLFGLVGLTRLYRIRRIDM